MITVFRRARLVMRLARLARLGSRHDARQFVVRHPELLSDDALLVLEDTLTGAVRRGYHPLALALEDCRVLIRRMREEAAGPVLPLDNAELDRRMEVVLELASSGAPRDVLAAITKLEALAFEPGFDAADVSDRLRVLGALGTMHMRRFKLSGHPTDLLAARAWFARAEVTAAAHPYEAFRAALGLALSYQAEFDRFATPAALRKAVEMLRRIPVPADDDDRVALDTAVGTAVLALFDLEQDGAHLTEAITRMRAVMRDRHALSDTARLYLLRNIGHAMLSRYRVEHQRSDLEDGISVMEAGLDLAKAHPDERAWLLNQLAAAYVLRARVQEDPAGLREAVELLRRGLALLPPEPHKRAVAVAWLGETLRELHARTGEVELLDEAVALLLDASTGLDNRSQERVRVASALGSALLARYRLAVRSRAAPDAASLRARISALRAGDFVPGRSPAEDLMGAVASLDAAFRGAPSPDIASPLAAALGMHADITGSWRERTRARRLFRLACRGPSETILEASSAWGEWALRRGAWREAAQAYGRGLDTARHLFDRQAGRAHKEDTLRGARTLAPGAAYAAARLGRTREAVEVLEQGRARLLAEVLWTEDELPRRLEQEHPALAARFRAEMGRVNAARGSMEVAALPELVAIQKKTGSFGEHAEQMDLERAGLDTVLSEIRRIPGFAAFTAPLRLPEIAAAAAAGAPLVYLVATPVGGMALIVEPDGRITSVWLDGLTSAAVQEEVGDRYLAAYRGWRAAVASLAKGGHGHDYQWEEEAAEEAYDQWIEALDGATRWAWDAAMGPILGSLEAHGLCRAVLIPHGLLQVLPLHAAWREAPGAADGRVYALEQVLLTYAPGARSLRLRQVRPLAEGEPVLLVDDPNGDLHHAEGAFIQDVGRFDPAQTTLLRGADATYLRVVEALPGARLAHFAAHGVAEAGDPLRSRLRLSGSSLTLREVLGLDLSAAPLVFLSACETTFPGTDLPDEVISLSTGFLQAGAAGVVGSLWLADDEAARMLALAFYRSWRVEGTAPAEAFWHAQLALRANPDFCPPALWSAFTFTGAAAS